MFGEQFYPTPMDVAEKMLAPVLEKIKAGVSILEPSAGKGDLLNAIIRAGAKKESVYAIEIDPDLTNVLTGRGYRVIDRDFLTYTGNLWFDLVIMNPPFNTAVDHIFKAWEIVGDGGDVICLMNANTIANPSTAKQELLCEIIEQYGDIDYLGNCFISAERRTNVEVAMVRLKKPVDNTRFKFDWETLDTSKLNDEVDISFENSTGEVYRADFITALVDAYSKAGRAYLQFRQAKQNLDLFMGPFYDPRRSNKKGIFEVANDAAEGCKGDRRAKEIAAHNAFLMEFQKDCWATIFEKTKVRNVITSKAKEDFFKFLEQQAGIDFSVKNIDAVFETLLVNRREIMDRCILEVFDKMCAFHADNKIHWEGWKTNDAYKVNKKVIIPYLIYFRIWSPSNRSGNFEVSYQRKDAMDDIDRVMCLLTGKKMEYVDENGNTVHIATIYDTLSNHCRKLRDIYPNDEYQNEVLTEFFHIKFWKKGTCHITFRDPKLWETFNIRAAQGKNWLPG